MFTIWTGTVAWQVLLTFSVGTSPSNIPCTVIHFPRGEVLMSEIAKSWSKVFVVVLLRALLLPTREHQTSYTKALLNFQHVHIICHSTCRSKVLICPQYM